MSDKVTKKASEVVASNGIPEGVVGITQPRLVNELAGRSWTLGLGFVALAVSSYAALVAYSKFHQTFQDGSEESVVSES